MNKYLSKMFSVALALALVLSLSLTAQPARTAGSESLQTPLSDQPPSVASTVPAEGATNVPLNSDIIVTFSE